MNVHRNPTTCTKLTLASVIASHKANTALSPTRQRDLLSAVRRMADILGDEPAAIDLDFPAIAAKLATLPVTAAMGLKTFQNIRSGFIYAVQVSGLLPVQRWAKKTPLAAEWAALLEQLSDKAALIVFSRLGRYASGRGVSPSDVSDTFIDEFMAYVRQGSLYHDHNPVHRKYTMTWNATAKSLEHLGLQHLKVPSFRRRSPCVAWSELSSSFRNDIESYLSWCAQTDITDESARDRPLAPASRQTIRNLLLYAASALIKSGIPPQNVTVIADLVAPDHFQQLIRWRAQHCPHQAGATFYVAFCLVQAARDWAKVDPADLDKLKLLMKRLPRPKLEMSKRNKVRLRQFNDPQVKSKFFDLPEQLWSEAIREPQPDWRTLNLAQCAIAIAFLTYIPLRRKNLCALEFGRHIFLHEGKGSVSTIEIPSAELKAGGDDLAFDIPDEVARMLLHYRNVLAATVIGRRPSHVFVNAQGEPKALLKVSQMISRCLKQRTGIDLHVHGFRHAHGKFVLDKEPGAYETVRQMLGHKNLETTRIFYAGTETRRAARHHHRLIDTTRAELRPKPRLGRRGKGI